jgi:FdhE protein
VRTLRARGRSGALQRILEPGQIEALASRSVPRLVLPRRERLFAARAERLRALAAHDTLGGFLGLVAAIADAQHAALGRLALPALEATALATARQHGMPLVPARGFKRGAEWRDALGGIAAQVGATPGFPPAVGAVCARLVASAPAELDRRAERLLAADGRDADPAAAPFIIAALQTYWVALAASLAAADVPVAEQGGVCPVCGTLPVASIVRTFAPYAGYRYLHCGLCATEWHRVRVECTQCGASKGIAYQSIEGGPSAIRAETCDSCRSYRKILYQEHDAAVEPLADDLASVALDLLLTEAGFHRASANPLLWQAAD